MPQSFFKYLSWSQVYRLKLRHETSQVAATQGGAVCDGSLETHHKYEIMYDNV